MAWKTKNEYYDIEDGNQISEKEAKTNYIILKKDKYVYIQNGNGTITYTNQCRRVYQSDLFTETSK